MISTKMLILIQKGDRLAMGANLGGLGGRLNFRRINTEYAAKFELSATDKFGYIGASVTNT
jgi:hypothetical protein